MEKEVDGVVVNEETGEVISEKQDVIENKSSLLSGLSDLFGDLVSTEQFNPKSYTTELLSNIEKIEPSISEDQLKELIDYVKGSSRPDFMDTMMTQTNEKLVDVIRVMVILQLLRIPALVDFQSTIRKNLTSPDALASLSYEELSRISANTQKEMSDILTFALRTATNLSSQNQTPTKVEKLANALMGVSEATRDRIEEIIKSEM